MPYQIRWLVEKRVLMTTLSGNLSTAELHAFIAEITLMVQSGTPLVHHISDSLNLGKVEMSFAGFRHLSKVINLSKEILWQVDINHNPVNKMLASVASQFFGVHSRTVKSLDEAVDFLRRVDPTLTEAQWNLTPPVTTGRD